MTARVNVRENPDIGQSVFEIQLQRFFLRAVKKKIGVVGVKAGAQMVGSYYEIKIMFPCIGLKETAEMRLQAQFDSESEIDLSFVFIFHFQEVFFIKVIIQLKGAGRDIRIIVVRKLRIVMIRKAHNLQPLLYS